MISIENHPQLHLSCKYKMQKKFSKINSLYNLKIKNKEHIFGYNAGSIQWRDENKLILNNVQLEENVRRKKCLWVGCATIE